MIVNSAVPVCFFVRLYLHFDFFKFLFFYLFGGGGFEGEGRKKRKKEITHFSEAFRLFVTTTPNTMSI